MKTIMSRQHSGLSRRQYPKAATTSTSTSIATSSTAISFLPTTGFSITRRLSNHKRFTMERETSPTPPAPITPEGATERPPASCVGTSHDGVFINARIARYFTVPITDRTENWTRRTVRQIFFGTVTEYNCPPTLMNAANPASRTRGKKVDDEDDDDDEDGVDEGLYRVRYDDGDTEALEPDEIYQAFTLHNDEMERLGRNMRGYAQLVKRIDPVWREEDKGRRDGMHQRGLSVDEKKSLDAERIGYWECYREYNVTNHIPRPLPLVTRDGLERHEGDEVATRRSIETMEETRTAKGRKRRKGQSLASHEVSVKRSRKQVAAETDDTHASVDEQSGSTQTRRSTLGAAITAEADPVETSSWSRFWPSFSDNWTRNEYGDICDLT
mmetsp:Transcript_35497/g.77035  ORF Transcript_35497/g.77035 Transcript_35497/m.77035 type:complete len:384 (-) Transcript_35497:294-1445(-)